MGKIIDVYNEYISRVDALVDAGTFKQHYIGLEKRHTNGKNMPYIKSVIGSMAVEPNDMRDRSIALTITATIVSVKRKDDAYQLGATQGILQDIEAFLNGVISDCTFGSTADVLPTYTINTLDFGDNFVEANIDISILTRPFESGEI